MDYYCISDNETTIEKKNGDSDLAPYIKINWCGRKIWRFKKWNYECTKTKQLDINIFLRGESHYTENIEWPVSLHLKKNRIICGAKK